jgi:Ras-related protein Rab-1A
MDTYQLKIMLAGPGSGGKTACRLVFTEGKYVKDPLMTLGCDFSVGEVEGPDYTAKLDLWDLAGKEQFGVVRKHYYNGVHGVVLVFDLTNLASFGEARKFFFEEIVPCTQKSPPRCIAVVGNKMDLVDKIAVDDTQIDDFVKEAKTTLGCNAFSFKTSAKEMKGVNEMFQALAECVIAELRKS